MKKTNKEKIGGPMLIASLALALVSCEKQLNGNDNNINNGQAEINSNSTSPVSSCGAIPDSLQVPAGNKLALQAYAKGYQIYQVKRSTIDTTVYTWVNIAPAASLYARPDYTNEIGSHYAGPSWEFTKGIYKGEKVVASKLKGVTVDATAVPWLLLKAVDSLSSAGNKVTYIQRVCTTGGLAPATGASAANVGQKDSIPYTAIYLFYESKN